MCNIFLFSIVILLLFLFILLDYNLLCYNNVIKLLQRRSD
nr:MAG TPA: hypothetical protein [Caudoviricetes sp.]